MATKGEETRTSVLDLALRLSTQVGLEGLTIGSLAKEAGMSKSGLYAHFDSKERLQIDVLETAAERFRVTVLVPALKQPRGEKRIRAIFEGWLVWENDQPGGCVFITASNELDDRPGPVRDCLVRQQQEWLDGLAKAARIAVDAGDFRPDLDAEHFAFELYGLILSYHFYHRLLRSPKARPWALAAFDLLLERSRA